MIFRKERNGCITKKNEKKYKVKRLINREDISFSVSKIHRYLVVVVAVVGFVVVVDLYSEVDQAFHPTTSYLSYLHRDHSEGSL